MRARSSFYGEISRFSCCSRRDFHRERETPLCDGAALALVHRDDGVGFHVLYGFVKFCLRNRYTYTHAVLGSHIYIRTGLTTVLSN